MKKIVLLVSIISLTSCGQNKTATYIPEPMEEYPYTHAIKRGYHLQINAFTNFELYLDDIPIANNYEGGGAMPLMRSILFY